mgnify:CR=1 FL=1
MALPQELKQIPVDGNYSMDEAAIVESLINSGQLSVQQISDYFGMPAAQINQTLTQDFGYTPQQVATVATTPTIAGVAPDMDYSQADAQAVEQAIRSGQVTTQQVADQFNVPVADVNRVLTTDFGYTPERIQQVAAPQPQPEPTNPLAGVAADNDYSMADARIVENAIRSGQVSIQEVSDYFGLPVAEVNRVLTTDFGYTPDQISSFGGGQVTTQTTGQTTTDSTTTGGTTTATTGGATGGTTGGTTTPTGGLAGRQVSQVTQPNLFATQQGVGPMGGISYADPNVLGGQVNMPQTGVIGAEAALQGGLSGGLAGLQEGLATGATGLTGAVSSGLQELRRALGQGRQDIQSGYGRAEQGFQPYMQGGEAAQAQLEALTGARGQEAFQQAYQESPYIQFLREQGMRANLAGAAATGGLGGGNVQKELARFGQGLASQGLQQQIQNLQGLAGQGLQATQGAGQYAAGGAGQMAGLQQAQGTQALGAMQNVGNQLANLGLAGGQTAAQMAYGTGQQLASGRTRAGELLAGEISNVGRDVSGLASALGGDISGVYGAQSQNLANLLVQSGMSQADAARIASQQLANIATGSSGQVTGLGTSVGQPQQNQGMLGQLGQLAGGLGTGYAAVWG